MAQADMGTLLSPLQVNHFSNMSSLEFDSYVYSLGYDKTGCIQPGALPIPLARNDTCLPGWYCPRSNDYNPPQYCPPTPECQVRRAGTWTCPPQGAVEPRICNNGHYCPSGGKQELECPRGTFCPTGSVKPFNCSSGALCPAMSQRQLMIAPLIATVIIDAILLAIVGTGFGVSKWRKKHHKMYTTLNTESASIEAIGSHHAANPPVENSTAQPAASGPMSSTDGMYEPHHSNMTPASSAHGRRTFGRADNMDGLVIHESTRSIDDHIEEGFHNSPDLQRFIRSMSKTIETSSIGLSFDFEHLGFTTKGGQSILEEVTGSIPRGSFWGIMGGSGAGKTTFVNTLMGKQRTTGGTIKINGLKKDMCQYKKLIGYVPQDDIVFPELTVRENLLHAARCRLPRRWRDKAIQDHIDSLIACLQLTHVQHSRVGEPRRPVISGGQRKRVNIGMELAAAPMAIFLDEPTSGLDATSASSIMRLLRALSRLGVTTIAIVHQPREQIFAALDHVLVLSQGRSVYSGPTEEVQRYFENLGFTFPLRENPADILIDITTGEGARYVASAESTDTDGSSFISTWNPEVQQSSYEKNLPTHLQSTTNKRFSVLSRSSTIEQERHLIRTMKARGATWPAQAFYCFYRAMTQQVRRPSSFFFEVCAASLAGTVIGLSAYASAGHLFQGVYHPPFTILSPAVDYKSTPQMGLLSGMAIGLVASAPGFWVFGEEKLMYYRETASGHSRSAYYVGKLLSTVTRVALSAFHFTVALNVLATPLFPFQLMYVANLMYFWCIYGLASIIAMLVNRENGPLVAVLASLIIGIFGGVAPPLSTVKDWHMEWFWRLSPGVWFAEAYFTENLTPLKYLYMLDLAEENVGYTLGQYWLDAVMLFVIGAVYRCIAYIFLILVKRDKQR